ncbi:MAG TPA: hypothetical protein VKZ55_04445 [Microthrixaceae bacterium]|nr:hypothetical protein [Microthrixaceae bacterium]
MSRARQLEVARDTACLGLALTLVGLAQITVAAWLVARAYLTRTEPHA